MAEQKEKKKQESPEEKRKTRTAFNLMIPFLIVAVLALLSTSDLKMMVVILGCSLWGFLILRQFIDDYYRIR